MKKSKLLIPVVLLLMVGLCSGVLLREFWSYEKTVVSVPYPLTAEILADFDASISPGENDTLRVLLLNNNTDTRTFYLNDNSDFASGLGWQAVRLNGSIELAGAPFDYNWGDPITLGAGENHILLATIYASDNLVEGTSVIRIVGSYE